MPTASSAVLAAKFVVWISDENVFCVNHLGYQTDTVCQ